MGGEIHVESRLGEGSRFRIELPCVVAEGALESDTAADQERAPPLKRLLGRHLLVAEDNEVNQLVLQEMLTDEGATLTVVGNGRLAVEAILRQPDAFDLILMDVQMPEMDGLEAVRRILALAPDLPVVGQTAHALVEEQTKCRRAGMVETLIKPLDREQLVAAVLRHRAAWAGGASEARGPNLERLEDRWRQSVRGCRLLLVEDDAINQEIALDLLRGESGLEVDVASDGQEAVEMARANHYDLILMDMRMPRMDGPEATARIRQLPGHALTPILAMTASDLPEDLQSCLEAGMNDVLPKPVDPARLYQTLLGWLPLGREGR
jgi:CheY-like chemotaxis protein